MRVYRLERAYDRAGNYTVQQIGPVDPDHVDWFNVWSFRCASRSSVWPKEGALVEILNPTDPPGNFQWLEAGAIGMDRLTIERLAPILPKNAEYLDVKTEDGQAYQLWNILDCTDCVDEEQSERLSLPTRARVKVIRFAFRAERIPDSSLFKASAAPGDVLTTSGFLPPDRDFKLRYELLSLVVHMVEHAKLHPDAKFTPSKGNVLMEFDFGATIGTTNGKPTSTMRAIWDGQSGEFLTAYPVKPTL